MDKKDRRSLRITITRRSFLKYSTLTAAGLVAGYPTAARAKSPGVVEFTSDVAGEMALRLAESFDLADLSVRDTTTFYDTDGAFCGYIVELKEGNVPRGYVVLGINAPFAISELCFDEGASFAYGESVSPRSSSGSVMVKVNPLEYGLADLSTGNGVTPVGNEFVADVAPIRARNVFTPHFMEMNTAYASYAINGLNHVTSFTGFTDDALVDWRSGGSYACGVASAAAVCDGYVGLDINPTISIDELWGYICPDGINGATITEIASGVRSYCRNRGRNVTYSILNSPNFANFGVCINRGDYATLGLTKDGVGHAVTVEGYAQMSAMI